MNEYIIIKTRPHACHVDAAGGNNGGTTWLRDGVRVCPHSAWKLLMLRRELQD